MTKLGPVKVGQWIPYRDKDHLAELFAELNRRGIGAVVDFSSRWIRITQVPEKAQQ